MTKPSIVFAHGIWADGSCFQKLIPTLRAEGHEVMAAQYGLDTLKGDVDATIRTFGRVSGPIVLVGHSYGGTVITHAGMDPRVAALVYIAALGPDETETSQGQQDKFPKTDVFKQIEVADGRVWMKPDGVACFAGDLSPRRAGRRLCDPLRASPRSVYPETAGWHRLAVEAELVHRGHRGSHCPS
jgi:pimeloyl-ACP methyl ester carboxylesterase